MTLHYRNKNDEKEAVIGVLSVKVSYERGIAEIVLASGKRFGISLDKIIDIYYR